MLLFSIDTSKRCSFFSSRLCRPPKAKLLLMSMVSNSLKPWVATCLIIIFSLNYMWFCHIYIREHMQSAKTNMNVEEVFFSIARDIKQRLADTDSKAEVICWLSFVLNVFSYSLFPPEKCKTWKPSFLGRKIKILPSHIKYFLFFNLLRKDLGFKC